MTARRCQVVTRRRRGVGGRGYRRRVVIQVHVAERTDVLADELAGLLATPLDDPFAEELVVVPAKGVERWLTQRLSHHLGAGPDGSDGVCAGVRFLNPSSLVALLTGTDRTDPWAPDRLVWPVLDAVDASLHEPWCAPLARHLGEGLPDASRDLRRDRRWSVARRLAGLFARYAVQRPRLVLDWSAGRDTDGAEAPLDPDLLWQPELWRRVVALVAAPPPQQRHADTLAAIRAGEPLALPDRLSMFGHTRMPVTEVELLDAVGEVREVHLWLPTPSPVLWAALGEGSEAGPSPAVAEARRESAARAAPVRRRDDDSATRVQHRLLASLGRDSRELHRTLGALAGAEHRVAGPAAKSDTLLGWLQTDLAHDREPDGQVRRRRVKSPDDRTVQVHAAHGRARQVEVLREVLVGLLQDDPSLEPRDILVMCPDIDVYAPLVQAGFDLGAIPGGHPAHGIRVRLADRGLAETNPFMSLAHRVLHVAGGRATLTEVLDLAGSAPVRQRFGFTDADLVVLGRWAQESGVRWGLRGSLRAAYQLHRTEQNTWAAGLDRLLVGVAASEDGGLVGDVLPLDDVPSAAVDLAGRFAELVDRLTGCVEALTEAGTLDGWLAALSEGVFALGAAAPFEEWQTAQLERELQTVAAEAGVDGDGGPLLRLADVAALLAERSAGRPTRANFRTGSLTVCTMVPMRSVPHRVVCLLGLDDGVFPRRPQVDGDDVLARNPLTGERDPRSEDRQLLLDAVLAATEHLVVVYSGADEQTGQQRPPAVPLGELLDALDTTASGPVREQVLVRHPLQPYDPRSVVPGALVAGTEPFSFDPSAAAGAAAVAGGRTPRMPFLPGPLTAAPPADLALADLQAFFAHPVRAFLRLRLDVTTPREEEEPKDAMPVQLDALERWSVGDRLVRRVIDGATPTAAIEAELRRQVLPPACLGEHLLRDVAARAQALLAASTAHREQPSRSVDVSVVLGGDRRLVGSVADVRGDGIVRVTYSALAPRQRIAAWLDLLALGVAHPGTAWTATCFAWGRPDGVREAQLWLPPDPAATLGDLVAVFDTGLTEPLPLPLRTAEAWCAAERVGQDADKRAADAWHGSDGSPVPGEREDREHLLVHGRRSVFADVAGTPRPAEDWSHEPTRLGRYAARVWTPLCEHERVVRRR